MIKNKKGIAQFFVLLLFIVGIIAFMFLGGAISGAIFKFTLSRIPVWFWIALGIGILFLLTRKK